MSDIEEKLNFALNTLRLDLGIDPSISNLDTPAIVAAFQDGLKKLKPTWIPCTQSLPENDTLVKFVREGSVFRGYFMRELPNFPYFCAGGCRYWYPSEKVTHWMPDPDPEPPRK